MLPLTGDTSVWRMVVLILILVVALAFTAGGYDLLTALLLSTVVIGLGADVVGRCFPQQKEAA